MNNLDHRARWLALYTLCLGDLLIVLDMSIVNVALPSNCFESSVDARSW